MFVPRSVGHKNKQSKKQKPTSLKSSVSMSPHVGTDSPALPKVEIKDDKHERKDIKTLMPKELRDPLDTDQVLENSNVVSDDVGSKDDVISYRKDQRWPMPGEPVCVMCGRYAEYICDQTDTDVCSLECKGKHLADVGMPILPIDNDNKCKDVTQTSNSDTHPPSFSLHSTIAQDTLSSVVTEHTLIYSYKEHDEIKRLSNEQVDELKVQLGISIRGIEVPRPILEFRHLSLPEKLSSNLHSAGYESPTAVQMQVLPVFLCQRDTMVCAQTSSGKTLAFLLPIIIHIQNHMTSNPACHVPLALILAPTRELCMQIEDQAKELMQGIPRMKTSLLVGGLPMPTQLYRLSKGVQLIVATPGRLKDILDRGGVILESLQVVIIDEMDSMLHMGFQEQVLDILKHAPDDVQTMMCSATIPSAIEKMASSLLSNPVYVSLGKPSMPNEAVRQIILWVEEPSKKKKLYSILQDPKYFKPPMVVFVESRVGADFLAEAIHKICGVNCLALHGEKQQSDRTFILQQFLDGNIQVLVCTGLVGRGIDFPKVKLVINFDMPSRIEQYVHQVGRASRLGERGTTITFINNGCKYMFADLVKMLESQQVPLPAQLLNSPHLLQQRDKRKSQHQRKYTVYKKHTKPRDDYSDSDSD
ncbi:putative ATP-dependent RNA helicase DDX59 [Saccoglossus kowalevskii]